MILGFDGGDGADGEEYGDDDEEERECGFGELRHGWFNFDKKRRALGSSPFYIWEFERDRERVQKIIRVLKKLGN